MLVLMVPSMQPSCRSVVEDAAAHKRHGIVLELDETCAVSAECFWTGDEPMETKRLEQANARRWNEAVKNRGQTASVAERRQNRFDTRDQAIQACAGGGWGDAKATCSLTRAIRKLCIPRRGVGRHAGHGVRASLVQAAGRAERLGDSGEDGRRARAE